MRERVDIDRLRALHVRLAAYLTRADVLEMVSAVPALLDAAEERDRLRQSLDAANDALDASGKTTFRIREERDDARAQLDAVMQEISRLEWSITEKIHRAAELAGAPADTMQCALEADGEKLRQMTGKDHGPRSVEDF